MSALARPDLNEKVITELMTAHRRGQWALTIESNKQQMEFQKAVREKVKGIKGFWAWTLYQHQGFYAAAASKHDMDALSHLTDIEVKRDVKDPREVEVVFTFSENPYFSNETLIKKFVLSDEAAASKAKVASGELPDEVLNFTPEEDLVAKATEINWKSDDKNLVKLQPSPDFDGPDFDGDLGSFFNWFTASVDPLDIRNIIVEEICPDAMDYYMGEGEFSPSDDEEDDDEDEEGGDDEEEIDLLEEEQPSKKKARKA